MNIVIISNSYLPQPGGLEIAIDKIAKELVKLSHDVTIITSGESITSSKEVDQRGFAVYRLPFFTPRIVTHAGSSIMLRSLYRSLLSLVIGPISLLHLLTILRKIKPDVVNLHYVGDIALFCILACRLLNLKLMVNLHGNDIDRFFERSFFPRLLTRTTLSCANRVVANSKDVLNKAMVVEPDIKSKSCVIGNGVDLSEFGGVSGYLHHRDYILNVANFTEKKGQDVLISAFVILHQLYPDIDLILVGDGHTRRSCMELARSLGVHEVIKFMGKVDSSKIPSIVAGACVFVLSSRKEPFGIVILEAMASQKPIVATSVGGVPDIIEHGKNGILVAPDNPEQLAEGIRLLLENKAIAADLAKKAYEDAVNKYSWSKVISEYVNEYTSIMKQG